MSGSSSPSNTIPGSTLVLGIVAIVCVSIIATAVVAVLAPEQAVTFGASAFAVLSSTTVVLANLMKTNQVSNQVAEIQEHTDQLVNGLADAKTRTAIADVVREEMIDPKVRPQLMADRARLDEVDKARRIAAVEDEIAKATQRR